MEANQKTPEISTEELRKILADKSAMVFDSRKYEAYAIDHIPGVINAPGDVSVIDRAVQGNKEAPIVVYCNGPFCRGSKRLADKLVAAGYTNVRRYQLGIPLWRVLGGVTERELEGVRYILNGDKTAVFLDARSSEEFKKGSLPGARNFQLAEAKKPKIKARLRIKDWNTRIIAFGKDGRQARAVAEEFAKTPFHNVSYFGGTFDELMAKLAHK
jgi:rhodanese-related sulfurtransferase